MPTFCFHLNTKNVVEHRASQRRQQCFGVTTVCLCCRCRCSCYADNAGLSLLCESPFCSVPHECFRYMRNYKSVLWDSVRVPLLHPARTGMPLGTLLATAHFHQYNSTPLDYTLTQFCLAANRGMGTLKAICLYVIEFYCPEGESGLPSVVNKVSPDARFPCLVFRSGR